MKPYTDNIHDDFIIREFDENIDPTELVWHRDKMNRDVEIISGDGWKFQFDGDLPFLLKPGDTLKIYNNLYHRIFIGNTKLVIKIKEY